MIAVENILRHWTGWFFRARRFVVLTVTLAVSFSADGHVGSPNVFFEGPAGAYPVRIVVRPPGVIPGLAEISVRVFTNQVARVRVVPIRWDTGRTGAPPPDEARLVAGESNLYSAQLWFMRGGAQSVEVSVEGGLGAGTVTVPVNAVATRVLAMPANLGMILAIGGGILVGMLALIVGGAVRETALPPGTGPNRKRIWGARAATLGTVVIIALILRWGEAWWDDEASDYRLRRLYHPMAVSAEVVAGARGPALQLHLNDENFQFTSPLMPDHGKLMHLFLVREADRTAFAHLHPKRIDLNTFAVRLPDLPGGRYRLYADVTYETGYADTLTASVEVPEKIDVGRNQNRGNDSDPDDAWKVSGKSEVGPPPEGGHPRSELSRGYVMEWIRESALVENRDVKMRFAIRRADGSAVSPEPYMGMLGHLILQNADGTVFTHLHPSGSYSMVARQLFEMRAEGKAPLRVANSSSDPVCTVPPLSEAQVQWLRANPLDADGAVSFPFAFPKAGSYRLWVQMKVDGQIETGVFDASVSER